MRQALLALLLGIIACTGDSGRSDSALIRSVDSSNTTVHVPDSIDHVLLVINDLQKGIAEFEERTGVRPQFGGAHPGRGTQNALVSLGDARYLEILAPNPDDSAGAAMAARAAPFETLTPYDWALRSEDLAALSERLRANGFDVPPPVPGSRLRPGGAKLEWRTLTLPDSTHPFVPFYIQWAAFSQHPATTSPRGCTLRDLRFEAPQPDEVQQLFARLGIEAVVEQGPAPRMRLVLSCPKGEVHFPSSD